MNIRQLARWAAALTVAMLGAGVPAAVAEPGYTAVPALLDAESPGGLGHWTVEYEKVAGGDPAVAGAINRILDDEAHGQVWLYGASASKTSPWTLNTQGRLLFRPPTISALFTGRYDAVELPNMPVDTVATRVFDSRSGIQIVWSNLFVDERAGLARLSELTRQILPATYPTPPLGGWDEYRGAMAPVERNYKYWIPTDAGIELHFPDRQFGRGVRAITIPWAAVSDLIAPEFAVLTS